MLVTTIYLALGSNLGDRAENIKQAIVDLAPEIVVMKTSPLYETTPLYIEDQPTFFNMICEAETDLAAEEVLEKVIKLQTKASAHEHNMPRVLDIDLIFYADAVISTPSLTIPHPKFRERDFVLKPLVDIAPDLLDPVSMKTMRNLLAEIPGERRSIIRRVA